MENNAENGMKNDMDNDVINKILRRSKMKKSTDMLMLECFEEIYEALNRSTAVAVGYSTIPSDVIVNVANKLEELRERVHDEETRI